MPVHPAMTIAKLVTSGLPTRSRTPVLTVEFKDVKDVINLFNVQSVPRLKKKYINQIKPKTLVSSVISKAVSDASNPWSVKNVMSRKEPD